MTSPSNAPAPPTRARSLRTAAAVGAFVLAAGATTLLATGSASADTPPPSSLTCNTASNSLAFQSTWTDTNTFALTPASPAPGSPVTATWTSATGLSNGSPSTLAAGSTQVQVVITLSGAETGEVVATTAPGAYPAAPVASGGALGPITATTTFTPSGTGTLTATVREVVFNSNSLDTYCSPAAGNYPAAGDPAPAYPAGYTPDYQSDTDGDATPDEYADVKVSGTATTVAVSEVTITAATEEPTDTGTPTATGTSTEPPVDIPTGSVGGLGVALLAGVVALGAYAWTRRPRKAHNHE